MHQADIELVHFVGVQLVLHIWVALHTYVVRTVEVLVYAVRWEQ